MSPPFTYASAFAGIGGFEVAFRSLGWEATFMSEINKHRNALLRRQFGDHVNVEGDISDVSGTALGRIRALIGGFPCKDTSIGKGHREGLAGRYSGLFYEFLRLLGEYMRLVDELGPEWVLIENTPGLLTSNGGRDMAAVVGGLEERGYGWAYRTVDGRAFPDPDGRLTPQRRARVLVLGHRSGDPAIPFQVLGDGGAGGEAAHPSADGTRAQGRPGPRLTLVGDLDDDEVIIWRKSARPTKSLAKGGYETWIRNDSFYNVLTAFDAGLATRQTHLVRQNGRLRTLTPIEWERLQGFPDGWTDGMPDSERLNSLGDAIHTGTALWAARRIEAMSERVRSIA